MVKTKLGATAVALTLGLVAPVVVAYEEAADKVAVCAGCHGPNGHSQVADNPILAAQHADYLVNALRAYISGERDYGIMKTLASRLAGGDI